MKVWIRKTVIVLVSILTFGLVTPSHAIWSQNQEMPKTTMQRGQNSTTVSQNRSSENDYYVPETQLDQQLFTQKMALIAEQQAMIKFGPKISPVIEKEFQEIILPNIIAAIDMTAAQYPEEELSNLAITEKPGGGVSEKIFNIYNQQTGQDIILFHVRREKPPLEGYRFNFHYHTYHDQFQTHHSIGTINWSKNTPPQWQSV
ncbi:YpjP family protein [Bacillus niameyensis]|uniref:YpjP family protein n=1 Tax=Bacillus niameyensis TaxID=1522308 RepID=UPI0007819684|nr:YpjP family protein [Bacillus niameyensis]